MDTTLYTPHSTLYTSHSALGTPHSTLYTPHFTLYAPHSTICTPHYTLYTPHSTLCALHFALRTFHFTLCTSYFSFHTLHVTLHNWHFALSTLHTLHFRLHTLPSDFTLHTLHLTLYTFQFTPHTHPHSTPYTSHSTPYTIHSTCYTDFCTPHFTFYTPHSTLYTLHPHFALVTSNSTIPTSYPEHSPLHTPLSLHSILCTPPHSTLHSLHWFCYRGRLYKAVEIIPFTRVFSWLQSGSLVAFVLSRSFLGGQHLIIFQGQQLPYETYLQNVLDARCSALRCNGWVFHTITPYHVPSFYQRAAQVVVLDLDAHFGAACWICKTYKTCFEQSVFASCCLWSRRLGGRRTQDGTAWHFYEDRFAGFSIGKNQRRGGTKGKDCVSLSECVKNRFHSINRMGQNHTFSCKEGNGAGGFKTVSCRLRMKPKYSLKPMQLQWTVPCRHMQAAQGMPGT